MSKEERNRIACKKYNDANKEKKAAYNKAYNEANKEDIAVKRKNRYESKKDGYYTVYYLKEEHYAGMTNNLTNRLYQHKSKQNRHVEDVEIIGKYETKEEATRVEAALHAMGYLGRHPQLKQQTLKQVL
tara:strand:+ start:189 stop:575 length:387 start_codon:yes stop_codon:yes gene_type:complete